MLRHLPPLVVLVTLMEAVACSSGSHPAEERVESGAEGSGATGDSADPEASTGDDTTGDAGTVDACADACTDLGTQAGVALCHSCRCKTAFDGWLPSTDELQCSNAETIVTYHATLSELEYELEPSPPSAVRCANPSLLTDSCRQGSKLGHITHEDVSMYWVCRDPYLDFDGSVIYEDMAVIGHNRRTGATCFWDDINDVMHDNDAPPLDLAEATEAERARSIDLFTYTDGSSCVSCHDHDPFLYTPYLQSTNWQSVAADKGPYHLVRLSGVPRSTEVSHIVSPEAAPCTSCHRLGSKNTCSFFAPDAFATHKIDAYEAELRAAAEPGSPHWPLAYWMPDGAQAVEEFEDWEAMFGAAREHVLGCCEAPGISRDGCEWAPVPVE